MAGQGRNADGLTGSQPRDAPNVVRFPGDWFGPLGDLVPIGTDANTEQDDQDLGADETAGFGADSFWGEDAQEVHRVATPAAARRPGRRSPRLRLLLPIGGVAVAALAVTVVLGSGTLAGKPGGGSHNRPARLAVARLGAASPAKSAGRLTGSAKPTEHDRQHVGGDRGRANRATAMRRAAKHDLPASAGARSDLDVSVRTVNTDAAANVATGDVATGDVETPAGLVPPPPNATQLTP